MPNAQRSPMTPRQRLIHDAQRGGVTLVLGAGVSVARGVPGWADLAADLLYGVTGERPGWLAGLPDDDKHLRTVRDRLRGVVPDEFLSRLHARSRDPHPLALPMVFERVEAALAAQLDPSSDADADQVEDSLAERIRDSMYRHVRKAKGDTLAVIAEVLRREQARCPCRIERVITFNADDLLECEVHQKWDVREQGPIVWWIARASHHGRVRSGAWGQPPIPVYHIHGFLPRDGDERPWADAPSTLVFTDAQYWQTVASPLSFANRVVTQALHDSRCVFIGLSMTDIDLMRWLGVRFQEIVQDRRLQREANGGRGRLSLETLQRHSLLRHSWIRVADRSDDAKLLADHLLRRGVETVEIASWGRPFRELMNACFPRL